MTGQEKVLNAAQGATKSDLVPADNVLIHVAGGHPTIRGVIDELGPGASNKIRIKTPTGSPHGLSTGDIVLADIGSKRPHGAGIGTAYAVTVIDVETFDLDSSVYTTALPGRDVTGYYGKWELVETTTTKWYPGVERWSHVQARGGTVTFDASGCALADIPAGALRPGDAPFEDEVIADGAQWLEGPLASFQMKTGGGAARLVRG